MKASNFPLMDAGPIECSVFAIDTHSRTSLDCSFFNRNMTRVCISDAVWFLKLKTQRFLEPSMKARL